MEDNSCADCQTLLHSDILTNLSCPYEIPRTEWAVDSCDPQNGVDNMATESYCHCHPMLQCILACSCM